MGNIIVLFYFCVLCYGYGFMLCQNSFFVCCCVYFYIYDSLPPFVIFLCYIFSIYFMSSRQIDMMSMFDTVCKSPIFLAFCVRTICDNNHCIVFLLFFLNLN